MEKGGTLMSYQIGKRICKFRKMKNISQKELAEMLKVSSSRISNWEQGINRPDVDILADICTALDVSPSELLNITLTSNEYSENERNLINAYRSHKDMQHAVNVLLGIDKI